MRYYSSTAQAATLTSDLSAGATSMTVSGTTGFPVSHPFTLVLDPGSGNEEIVDVTASSGTTLTITRGRDGTTARDHLTGVQVRHMVTARDLREAQEHINATSNVHGATGTLVTTTEVQTLTNKTLDGSQNFFANIPAAAIVGEIVEGGNLPTGVITQFAGATAPGGWLLCDGAAVSRTSYSALFAVIGTTYGSGDGSTTFNLPNLKGRIPIGLDATQAEFDALGGVGGSKTHTLSVAEMPYHNHGMNHTHTMYHSHSMDHGHNTRVGSNSHNHSGSVGNSAVAGDYSSSTYTGEGSRIMPGRHNSGRFSAIIQGSTHAHPLTINSNTHSHSVSVYNYSGSTGGSSSSSTSGASSTSTGSTGSGAAHNNLQPYITLNYIIKA